MDIQNFLDPMGGTGRGSLMDGRMGLIGMALEPAFGMVAKRYLRGEVRTSIKAKKEMIYGPFQNAESEKYITNKLDSYLYKNVTSKRILSAKNSIRSTKALVGKIGWAFTASWLFDIGQSMLTPGVSKSTNKSNMELIMNESPIDSGRAFTQRQRAMQAIYESQMNVGRSMIGQESSYLHM